jgi:hypothetical protein
MNTRETLECRALLAASGEAHLDDDERRRTAAWSRDLDALSLAAREAFTGNPSSRRESTALGPAARQALAQRRRRFHRLYLVRRLAAAAALVLLAGGALLRHAERRQQTRLERLGNVLFLIRDVETNEDDTLLAASPLTLEALAEQLRQMQFVSN